MKNRRLVLAVIAIGFAGFLAISYLAYNSLGSKYNQKNIDVNKDNSQEESVKKSTEQDKNMEKDFVVYDENLNKVKLSDYKGKPVVVNFWASWCPPCREEMPLFNEISNKYDENQLTVIMVNLTDGQRETVDTAKKFIKDNNYNMKVLFDKDNSAAISYNILSIPRTLFIDKNGQIVKDYSGEITNKELENQVKLLLSN